MSKPNLSNQTDANATMIDTFAAFMAAYPSYKTTSRLDDLRRTDYRRLDESQQIYLDYTGGGLYAQSQLQAHLALLESHVFGNPHSNNPTSLAMTRLVEQARRAVLDFFHASPDEYVVIFTPNASCALKLVGEAFPFAPGGHYLLTFDNHNSVNGIREFARRAGANVTYIPLERPELRVDPAALADYLDQAQPGQANLFAYPAQSNFSGVQHPLPWIEQAQAKGWYVLLDSAAFAPTNRLDLSRIKPDFVPLSFYKIFGYPTGVGCLLARKSALVRLRRPWFAGGTITITSVQGEGWHYLVDGEAGFEDGTVDYLNLPAVEIGLHHIEQLGLDLIHERVSCLTGWLLDQMTGLRHANGSPLVHIYGPTTQKQRGGTIAFNFYDPQDRPFDFRRVEALANQARISLRTGCFCNPGAGEIAHNVTKAEMAMCFNRPQPMSFNEFFEFIRSQGDKSASTIRISVGLATNFADVYHFIQFARNFLVKPIEHFADVELPTDPHGVLSRDTA
jgi:selenocysteine lyase/cysteine desulfurase